MSKGPGRPRLEDEPWQGWRTAAERALYLRRYHREPWREIARTLGVPLSTIRRYARRLESLESPPPNNELFRHKSGVRIQS
jgi:hypothetical protein